MQVNSDTVCNVQVGPREQRRISLGEFKADEAFKGFMVEFGPDIRSTKSISAYVQQVASSNHPGMSTFFMHIANQTKKTLRATVHTV